MKLNPDDVIVTSFETSSSFAVSRPTTDDEPTPATRCFDCPGDAEPVINPGFNPGFNPR